MIARSALYLGAGGFTLGAYAWLLVGLDALVPLSFFVLALAGAFGVAFQSDSPS